jgi:hypothetical protein
MDRNTYFFLVFGLSLKTTDVHSCELQYSVYTRFQLQTELNRLCAGHYLVGWINAGSCIHSPGIQSGNLPLCLPLSESLTYVVKAEHKITLLPSSTVCLHASFFFRAKYVLGCLFKITLTC